MVRPSTAALTAFSLSTWRRTAVASAVLAAGAAWAQTPRLDEVVISASRAEQRSLDAPAALSSVDRSVIEAAGPQVNLSESLNRVPGLTVLNRQNYARDLQLSMTSTNRIDVLRGPLTQMDDNAAGGVIQAWTRDAPETPEVGVQLHSGTPAPSTGGAPSGKPAAAQARWA